jgi:hypothetical protein
LELQKVDKKAVSVAVRMSFHVTVESPPRSHLALWVAGRGEGAADTAALKKVRLRVSGRTPRAVKTHIVLLMANHFPTRIVATG